MRAGEFLKGRLSARERRTQRPLGRILLVLFLAGQEKYVHPALVELSSKIYPQPLWNVERNSVDKLRRNFTSTPPVEKL